MDGTNKSSVITVSVSGQKSGGKTNVPLPRSVQERHAQQSTNQEKQEKRERHGDLTDRERYSGPTPGIRSSLPP
jgi:hypothetical protein